MIALVRKAMGELRRGILGWSVSMVVLTSFYALFYPSVQKTAGELDAFLQQLPEAFRSIMGYDYSSPEGYLRTEAFAIMGPILFLVFAIGIGARTVASEEDTGTMDLLLSMPVRRRQVLGSKVIAMLGAILALGAATTIGLATIGPIFELTVPLAKLVAAVVNLMGLAVMLGTLALAVGCLTGSRPLALAVAGAYAAVSYVVHAMAGMVDWLEMWKPLTPFRWYLEPDPLRVGLSLPSMAVFFGASAVFVLIAFVGFERRDVRG